MKLIDQKSISAGIYSPRFKGGTPFLIEGCMILQCVRGNAAFRLNFQDYHIAEGNVVFLFNDMVIELGARSDDFEIRFVSVPETQVFEIYVNITSTKFWDTLYLSPVQKFDDTYYSAIDRWISECIFVVSVCRRGVADAVIPKLLISMFMVMEDIISSSSSEETLPFVLASWKIMGDFFVLLSRHYTTQHRVDFYAKSLNITPDYLSVVTKACTGIPPKETIDGKLVLAMKALLESTSLSIKNIADRLHYEDTSHLCKVFRRYTGMSPLEYRKQHK